MSPGRRHPRRYCDKKVVKLGQIEGKKGLLKATIVTKLRKGLSALGVAQMQAGVSQIVQSGGQIAR